MRALAVRSALRVLPLAVDAKIDNRVRARLIGTCFRAVLFSLCVLQYPLQRRFAAAAGAAAYASVWAAVSTDVRWLTMTDAKTQDGCAGGLLSQPPWLETGGDGGVVQAAPPPFIRQAWDRFAGSAFARDRPMEYFGKEICLRLAHQTDEWWDGGANAINADIAQWLAEPDRLPDALQNAVDDLPGVGPAAFRFEQRDGRIAAAPPDPHPINGGLAQDLMDAVRRKAEDLAERLADGNADPRILRSVQGLLDSLPEAVSALRPSLLQAQARSLPADTEAFGGELLPDALAMLIDLTETTRDLQACFPYLRELEAERMAQGLDPADADVRLKRIADFAPVVRNFLSTVLRFVVLNAVMQELSDTAREA